MLWYIMHQSWDLRLYHERPSTFISHFPLGAEYYYMFQSVYVLP